MKSVVILVNSSSVLDIDEKYLDNSKFDIYCTDGGANYAHKLDIIPNVIIGDLDSIQPEILDFFKTKNVEIILYQNQNISDLELAIKYAESKKTKQILIAGGVSGDPDHALSNFTILANKEYENLNLSIIGKKSRTFFLGEQKDFILKKEDGESLSLIPICNSIVSLAGTKWELKNSEILVGSSLTIRNRIISEEAVIEVTSGSVFVCQQNN
ncbi:MAG: thiamine diphosphokinase [Bdellovibrionales bacterium]|nr:thiamine diphosphokinase [Bdellovibrionales bacterium]